MAIEEYLVFKMNDLMETINKEGITKKIQVSEELIALLYVYLRGLGVSNDELSEFYLKYAKKPEEDEEVEKVEAEIVEE